VHASRTKQVRGIRTLRPAPRFCRSERRSGTALWRVPWFHEYPLLGADRRDDDPADDGFGCAAGDEHVARESQADTCLYARRPIMVSAGWLARVFLLKVGL
jgi:hypothetical protein